MVLAWHHDLAPKATGKCVGYEVSITRGGDDAVIRWTLNSDVVWPTSLTANAAFWTPDLFPDYRLQEAVAFWVSGKKQIDAMAAKSAVVRRAEGK